MLRHQVCFRNELCVYEQCISYLQAPWHLFFSSVLFSEEPNPFLYSSCSASAFFWVYADLKQKPVYRDKIIAMRPLNELKKRNKKIWWLVEEHKKRARSQGPSFQAKYKLTVLLSSSPLLSSSEQLSPSSPLAFGTAALKDGGPQVRTRYSFRLFVLS